MKDYEVDIAVLRSEHKAVDREIKRYGNLPGHCATTLRELKAKKLGIKDRIAQLEREMAAEAKTPAAPALSLVVSNDHPIPSEQPATAAIPQRDAVAAAS